jgi:hypothetical protein
MLAHKHPRLTEDRLQRYLHRSDEELRWDLVAAFDEIETLKDKLWSANMKVWILAGALTAEGAALGWLATALLDCIKQSHLSSALRLVQ